MAFNGTRRVVITGMGAITPIGTTPAALAAFRSSGVSPSSQALPTPSSLNDPGPAGPGDEPEEPLPPGYRRRVDRVALRKARQRRGR